MACSINLQLSLLEIARPHPMHRWYIERDPTDWPPPDVFRCATVSQAGSGLGPRSPARAALSVPEGPDNGDVPMRSHTAINERTVRRTFREQQFGRTGLTVIAIDLPAFGLNVSKKGPKPFFVRVAHPAQRGDHPDTREKALLAFAAAKAEHETGALFADFAAEFMCRQGRRWKPSPRQGNCQLINRHSLPFFGAMHGAEISRADMRRWCDAMSGTPGNANRTLPVLSVMMW